MGRVMGSLFGPSVHNEKEEEIRRMFALVVMCKTEARKQKLNPGQRETLNILIKRTQSR